ncbi:NrfD/PsrC family molybdoenzyme membrane anchor subunit [Desulfosediminicola flagellatus]|uniref:NrfD/PsrC family molybdoenzyme membrane anchor subunit n=1 Tax=Desulfosediminicola flagellatus TaxID=2569541 RepID=UPI00142E96D5|nr:NrfD/PsrC family molybdoenzyme membrane anchor subunit [Desulfosediminicola flagellatus]
MEGNIAINDVQEAAFTAPKFNVLLLITLLCIGAGVAAGIYAQVVGHHHAFANTRGMPWGMLIGVYAYFAIISTGLCLMAAITHVFHIQRLIPLANRMVWLSVVCLLGAFTVIGLEIENPWRMPLNMILSPNLTSNIWWMGTLYGLAMGLLMLELFLIITGRIKAAVILGLSGAVAEMLANSNLGSVFASLAARPFWYGAQLPIFFLASALLSGAAAVILFTHYAHKLNGRKMSPNTFHGLRVAGKIMGIMLFLILLATAWKFANDYCGTEELRISANALITGPLATSFWLFEIAIGLVLPLMLILFTRMRSLQALSLAALMILVGQFFSRFNLVVAGVIVPIYAGYDNLPMYQSYSPTVSEYLLVVAGLGVVGFGFLVGEKRLGSLFNGEAEKED